MSGEDRRTHTHTLTHSRRKFLAYEHWAKRHGFLPPDGEEKMPKPPPKPEYERYHFMLQPVMDEFGVYRPMGAPPGGPGYGEQWPGMSRTMHMVSAASCCREAAALPRGAARGKVR